MKSLYKFEKWDNTTSFLLEEAEDGQMHAIFDSTHRVEQVTLTPEERRAAAQALYPLAFETKPEVVKPDPTPPAPDMGVDRSEPPPGWFWEEDGSHRTGFVMQGNRQTLRAAWTIHDTLTAPIEARAREAEQANEAWREWAGKIDNPDPPAHGVPSTTAEEAQQDDPIGELLREVGRALDERLGAPQSAALERLRRAAKGYVPRVGDSVEWPVSDARCTVTRVETLPADVRVWGLWNGPGNGESWLPLSEVRPGCDPEAAPMGGTPDDEYEDCPACDGEAVSPDEAAAVEALRDPVVRRAFEEQERARTEREERARCMAALARHFNATPQAADTAEYLAAVVHDWHEEALEEALARATDDGYHALASEVRHYLATNASNPSRALASITALVAQPPVTHGPLTSPTSAPQGGPALPDGWTEHTDAPSGYRAAKGPVVDREGTREGFAWKRPGEGIACVVANRKTRCDEHVPVPEGVAAWLLAPIGDPERAAEHDHDHALGERGARP